MQRIFIFVLLALAGISPVFAESALQLPLTIQTQHGEKSFVVEIADTPEEKKQGLMYRTELPEDGGMIFIYEPPSPAYMWMRNTRIPLDMLFVSADGRIVHIEHSAAPYSEQPRGVASPVSAVIELSGGSCQRHGIVVGDRIMYGSPDRM